MPGRHRVAEEFLPLQLLSMLRLRVLSLAGCWNVHIPLCVGELQDLRQLVVRCDGCEVMLVMSVRSVQGLYLLGDQGCIGQHLLVT